MIAASHVKLLESAGAFVVPIDYKTGKDELRKLLGILNGLYIPGDTEAVLQDEQYLEAVIFAVEWAHERNVKHKVHFPIVTVSYGYLAALT